MKVKRQLQETVDAKLAATTKQAQEMEARVTSMTAKLAAGQDRLEKKMELVRVTALLLCSVNVCVL